MEKKSSGNIFTFYHLTHCRLWQVKYLSLYSLVAKSNLPNKNDYKLEALEHHDATDFSEIISEIMMLQ